MDALAREEFAIESDIDRLASSDVSADAAVKLRDQIRRKIENYEKLLEKARRVTHQVASSTESDGAAATWLEGRFQFLQGLRSRLHDALVTARRRSDNSDRASLLAGARMASASNMSAQSVTTNLHRVTTMLRGQVGDSDRTVAVLDASGAILRQAANEYRTMGTAMNAASAQTRTLRRRELTERVLIAAAVILFYCIVAMVIYRRL